MGTAYISKDLVVFFCKRFHRTTWFSVLDRLSTKCLKRRLHGRTHCCSNTRRFLIRARMEGQRTPMPEMDTCCFRVSFSSKALVLASSTSRIGRCVTAYLATTLIMLTETSVELPLIPETASTCIAFVFQPTLFGERIELGMIIVI